MLKLIQINKAFGEKKILVDFSYEFHKNIYCFTGASGIGKTTLMNIILGLVNQDSGEVLHDLQEYSVVFQENYLLENLTGLKNVLITLDKKEEKDTVLELFTLFGLKEDINKPIHQYSGGMKRRVSIIRALAKSADIYLFDEPFKELDYLNKQIVMDKIKELRNKAIVILITHEKMDVQYLDAIEIPM